MPDIYDWSVTAADNDDADSTINWLEGQLPSTVNNSARAMMVRGKQLVNDLGAAGTVAGTDTITVTSAIASLASNKRLTFKAAADNTGAATLNVNSLGAKALRKIVGGVDVALAAGDIKNGAYYEVIYNAAANSAAGAWIVLNPSSRAIVDGGTGASTAAGALTNLGITFGSWTPTLTSVANVDSATPGTCYYKRVGDHVDCWGFATVDPTAAANTTTQVGISLPVASNFGDVSDAAGVGTAGTAQRSGVIFGDATNDRVTLFFASETTAATTFRFMFSYRVI